jgi:hypothetical protein
MLQSVESVEGEARNVFARGINPEHTASLARIVVSWDHYAGSLHG